MNSLICILALLGVIVGFIIAAVAVYQIVNCKKRIYKTLGMSILVCTLSIPFLINELYKFGCTTGKGYYTLWEAKDALSFYGSYLAFLGTVSLGALSLFQNQKFKKENDNAQLKIERINHKLLELDSNREKEKIFEMYFSYLDQSQNIFNPEYVLGNPEENRSILNIFSSIKDCHLNILSIKRRLIFLDKDNSDNSFFEYIECKTEEISKITMESELPKEVLTSQLFNFWKNNCDDFNTKSLIFMIEIRKSIFNNENISK